MCVCVCWSGASLCSEVMICEITDITDGGDVVAFPLCRCPLISRGTIHVSHSSSPPSPLLSPSNCLSINPSFHSLSLLPHPPVLLVFPSSNLAPLLATIALSCHECQHPCDPTNQSVSEARVCCVFNVHIYYFSSYFLSHLFCLFLHL